MSNPAKKVIRWVTNCDADRLLRQKIEDSEIPRNLKAPDIVEYWKSEAEFQKYSASVFFSHYQTIIEELETNEAIESGATAPLISTKMSGKNKSAPVSSLPTSAKRSSAAVSGEKVSEEGGDASINTTTSSATQAANPQHTLTAYPFLMGEFRTGPYGEKKNIAMRFTLPDGVNKFEEVLHHDFQGIDIKFHWPASMLDVTAIEGLPDAALHCLNSSLLDTL
jgi:hypothetical protein